MENKRRKKKVVKPKHRFTICCFCLNSSSSDIDLKTPLEGNEAYDFVVEKLAIKKVPISLFATDEDLEEMQNINPICVDDYRYTPKDKESAVIFSSCYSKIPKNVKNVKNECQSKLVTLTKELSSQKTQENQSEINIHASESYKDTYMPINIYEKEIVSINKRFKTH